MRILAITCLMLWTISVQAQFEKILHQTFEVQDFEEINFDFYNEVEIEKWAGNVVLTETKVQLFDASPSIFNYYVNKAERYKLKSEDNGKSILIRSSQMHRKSIATKTGSCREEVKMRIFVPEDFVVLNDKKLRRSNGAVSTQKEESASNSTENGN